MNPLVFYIFAGVVGLIIFAVVMEANKKGRR